MIKAADSAPVRPNSSVLAIAWGRLATMPAKMISEVPLPTPRAVICSPSHIRNMVPPTSVITVVKRKKSRDRSPLATMPGHAFETDRDAIGLDGGDKHGQVAGVLIDLLAARLTLLLEGFKRRTTVVINCMMIEAEM